jgi:AcrR family transcriptional regulator
MVSNQPVVDARIQRTRTALEEAVLQLAEKQSFSSISVSEIARQAGVSRAVFYLHYRDKDDLVMQALQGWFDELMSEAVSFAKAHGRIDFNGTPSRILDYFQKIGRRPELMRRLLSGDGPGDFADRMRAFHERMWQTLFDEEHREVLDGSPPATLRAKMHGAALLGAVNWWLSDKGENISAETMSRWLWRMVEYNWDQDIKSAG